MGRQLVRFVDAQLKFDSKLVKLVKEHRHLFDRGHKLFNDGKTRIETWEYIAKELQETEIYCEKRWVYIIHRFYDEIVYMVKYSTASLWLLFPQLDFLSDYIEWEDIDDICNDFLMEYEVTSAIETETLPLG